MNIGPRKLKILEAIVDSYIATGEPVSSKFLCENLGLSVSSSTIRSDMADLTRIGLLEQPYTSSGRIPSHAGYRLYIEKLMEDGITKKEPIENERYLSEPILSFKARNLEDVLRNTLSVLAEITKCIAVSATPLKNTSTIKGIRLIFVKSKVTMIVLVTSIGVVKNRLVLCNVDCGKGVLDFFQKILQEKLENLEIYKLNSDLINTLKEDFFEISPILPKFFTVIIELAKEASKANINLSGENNLFFCPDIDQESALNLVNFFNSPNDSMVDFLKNNCNDEITVLVGEENGICKSSKLSVIISHYDFLHQDMAAIALIGPTRMNYAKLIPIIKYLTSILSGFLNKNFGN
ncbi:MAG: heat-inducible transcriptional repressor HrcA [Oscillospiraceae bacterium]|jgi:heat-inducible transcriptional repressor|nr:heat-inducible transcriptional repressor HrcA [Oscillospiraceae bacterium]